jgi:hypothetical protein
MLAALLTSAATKSSRADDAPVPPAPAIPGATPEGLGAASAEPPPNVDERIAPAGPRAEPVMLAAPPTRMRSKPLFYSGLGTAAVGAALLAVGIAIKPGNATCSGNLYRVDESCWTAPFDDMAAAYKDLLLVTGGAILAGGIVMSIVGGWEVPVTRSADRKPRSVAPPAAAFTFGPTSAGLRVTF